MKIGLYFGSFNPIHTGHCIIACYLLNETELDEVWFVVSPQNPFKESKTLLNEYDRLHLARLAIGQNSQMRVSDAEFHLQKPSYTSNTLAHLVKKYPQHKFTIIMGSDSYQNLPKWKNSEYITGNFPIYIYLRPGFQVIDPIPANVKVLQAPLLEISATQIRRYIKEKKSVQYMVPDSVQEEIEKNGYYNA